MIDNRTSPYAAALLRISLGVMFIAHGLLKVIVFTIPGTVAFFEKVGFPGSLAYVVIAAELVGGVLLVAGLLTRIAIFVTLPVLFGALTVHLANGWMFSNPNGGWEYPAFLLIAAVVQFLLGDGAFALANPKLNRRLDTLT